MQKIRKKAVLACILIICQITGYMFDIIPYQQVCAEDISKSEQQYADNKIIFITTEDNQLSREQCSELGIAAVENIDGLANWYSATLSDVNTDQVLNALNEMENIIYAEPNYVYYNQSVSVPTNITDSYMSSQWYLDNIEAQASWNIMAAQDKIPGQDVVVAVIDTGVNYLHPDLDESMWINDAEYNGVAGADDDGNGYVDDIYGVNIVSPNKSPFDDNGHGTHVAGIIGMEAGNGGGVGISYGTKIMAIKAGDASGRFQIDDILKGINYAIANGADIINMSFGADESSIFLQIALLEASKQCILVASAGNDGIPTTESGKTNASDIYPAAYPFVIGVMSNDSSNKLSSFSNWDYKQGTNTDYEIVAPGSSILSTYLGSQYIYKGGTSMAAPMVSGALAVALSYYGDDIQHNTSAAMSLINQNISDSFVYTDSDGFNHNYRKLNIPQLLNGYKAPEELSKFTLQDISIHNLTASEIQLGKNVIIYADISNGKGMEVTANYRIPAQNEWISTKMYNVEGDSYIGVIPADSIDFGNLKYYIEVNDGVSSIYHGSKEAPNTIIIYKDEIANMKISGAAEQIYTGNSIKPKVTVTDGNNTLKEGTDYEISYNNNINAGQANIIVTGVGKYIGKKGISFGIVKANVKKAKITGIVAKQYTGKATKQSVKVIYNGRKLTINKDYVISYRNNKSIGTASVTIKGSGNYTGTVTKKYKINPKAPTLKKLTKVKSNNVKITYKKVSKATGYIIYYSNKEKGTYKKLAAVKSINSYTTKKLKRGNTYYIKIVAVRKVNSTSYRSKASNIKRIVM